MPAVSYSTTPVRSSAEAPTDSLIKNLQAGIHPEENFQKIFERYYRIILSFFAKRGFGLEESKDLTQDVFLRVFLRIDSFRSDGPFEGWLFQIAANVFRNRLRDSQAAKRKVPEGTVEGIAERLAEVSEDQRLGTAKLLGPEEDFFAKEKHEVLRRALDDLPTQMRRCLVLRIHQDLKYREIASVMRISIETVKAHLYQARHRLKGELGRYYDPAVGGADEADR